MPKSVSFTSPAPDNRMFDGEMSRWMRLSGRPSWPHLRVRVGERLEDLVTDEDAGLRREALVRAPDALEQRAQIARL